MRRRADPYALPLEETSIAELAQAAGYSTSFVGKWHLTSYTEGWESAPADHGFDWFAIAGGNLNITSLPVSTDYYFWERNENGRVAYTETYATRAQADDAVARIQAMPEPWLLVLSFSAPHGPFHAPPPELHTLGDLDGAGVPKLYRAAVEAVDTEIARVLDTLSAEQAEHTYVVFTADNGTPTEAVLSPIPRDQSKPSLTEGGLRVPLILSGPGIQPGVSPALSGLVDLLPTFATWMDAPLQSPEGDPLVLDGIDLSPWLEDPSAPDSRDTLYAERFSTNGRPDDSEFYRRFIRGRRWKYGRDEVGREQLFDLADALYDTDELIGSGEEDPQILDGMRSTLDEVVTGRPYEYPGR